MTFNYAFENGRSQVALRLLVRTVQLGRHAAN